MSYYAYREATKQRRASVAKRQIPVIRELCNTAGISMIRTSHGYQFTFHEYVINWAPATNSVNVQYKIPGDSTTIPYTKKGQRGKSRIVTALEELIDLSRSEGRR